MKVKTNTKEDRSALIGLLLGSGMVSEFDTQEEFEHDHFYEEGNGDVIIVGPDGSIEIDGSYYITPEIVFPQNMARLMKAVKIAAPTALEVKLNEDYTALVNKSGISVGCVHLNWDKWRELKEAADQHER